MRCPRKRKKQGSPSGEREVKGREGEGGDGGRWPKRETK